jgi:CRP/FNR family transcriptional regulator, cyclic AMP receptor protein
MPISGPEALSKIPLFSHLSSRQLRKLQRSTMEHRYESDTTIVRERDRTTTLYVLLEGSVKVIRNGRTISRRDPGEYFGEIALIDGRPRAASVIAESPVRCLALQQEELRKLLMTDPDVSWALLQSLATRLRGE